MEQWVQGGMARRDLISKGLKGDHIKCAHINDGQTVPTFPEKSPCLGASEVHAVRRAKRKNSEVCRHWHRRNRCYEGGQTLEQDAEPGRRVSILEDIQNLPGHSPE